MQQLHRGIKVSGRCKICGGDSEYFDVVDSRKFSSLNEPYAFGLAHEPVYYERCTACEFVFTRHFDNWTNENFSEHIYNEDYVRVDGEYVEVRPAKMALAFCKMFPNAQDLRILDYGSGAGLLEKHLRVAGYKHVHSYDPFSQPVRPAGQFDIIICCEVVEHSPKPRETIEDIVSFATPACEIALTTGIQPKNICDVRGGWWYIAPRNGHVSIYSSRSLHYLAKMVGHEIHLNQGAFHIMRTRSDSPPCDQVFGAPDRLIGAAEGWHDVNPSYGLGEFRWTASQSTVWKISPSTRQLRITVPFLMEKTAGFASNCHFEAAGRKWPSQVVRFMHTRGIVAEINTDDTFNEVVLVSPPPVQSGNDPRKLGIGILVQPVSPHL